MPEGEGVRTVKTTDDLAALALKHGGRVNVGGRVFNSDMDRVELPRTVKPAEPTAKPSPTVEPEQPKHTQPLQLSRADLEQILHDRDAFWMAEMKRIAETIAKSLAPPRLEPVRPVRSWSFTPTYLKNGMVEVIEATPKEIT